MIHVTEELTTRQRMIMMNALWVWRSQLGRVGSGQPVPGLASEAAISEVDEIARSLGGKPELFCFGVEPPREM